MLGNVWEWSADWYAGDYYSASPTDDPIGPPSDSSHVLRGGSWDRSVIDCRSADREHNAPSFRDNRVGFRVLSELV